MNTHDKLIQLAEFAKTGEVFEALDYGEKGWSNVRFWDGENIPFNLNMLLACEIRSIPKLPLLTEEECEFLKYAPRHYYFAKDSNQQLYIHSTKPKEGQGGKWLSQSSSVYYYPFAPSFDGIKWSDSDCYTIGELIEYSKKVRNNNG